MIRRITLSLLLASSVCAPAFAADDAGLAQRLDALVARMAPPEAQVGVSAVDLRTGEVLYQRQANKLFAPASVQKLIISSVALSVLGIQHRFTTRLMTNSVVQDGVLRGHLILRGEGDPTLEAEDLEQMATSLHQQGVNEVAGDLIADASVFKYEGPGAPGWVWDDLPWGYGAPVGGLSLHRNSVDVTVAPGARAGDPLKFALTPQTGFVKLKCQALTQPSGALGSLDVVSTHGLAAPGAESWTLMGGMPQGSQEEVLTRSVADPAHFAATILKEALERHGVKLDGRIRLGATPTGARTLAQHQSPPLAELVRLMNKESDNLLAETLLVQVGVRAQGAPGTREKGLHTVRTFLERAGWKQTEYRLTDGSGLSRYDALTPAQLTSLLQYMPSEKLSYGALLISLPVAGVDGTLASRLADPATRGRIRAKTGTMTGVSALAGYVNTDDGRTLAVSILVNGFVDSPTGCRQMQDALVQAFMSPGGNN